MSVERALAACLFAVGAAIWLFALLISVVFQQSAVLAVLYGLSAVACTAASVSHFISGRNK